MAKLFLKFEAAVLKELSLTQAVVSIGRLPDNVIQIDNLAVSGHHAKVYWDKDHYVIEDNNSLNGTFVNNRRVGKANLKDNDVILIGKHTLSFKDEGHAGLPAPAFAARTGPVVPQMEATVVFDNRRTKEALGTAAAAGASVGSAPSAAQPAAPQKDRIGVITVLDGKTDEKIYSLGKMSVIGKSDMASIKLKAFFAPNMAALINKRDGKYFITASESKIKVKINAQEITGQKELSEGDVIEVVGVKMAFAYQE